jgi:DNA-binding beta-propeller fold protein YncE
MRGVSSLIRLKVSFSAATARSGFELFGELIITGQDTVAVLFGEDITKGSPVVVKIDFDPTKLADPATLPTGTGEGCAFDPTGTYLAVAHSNSPYITIYKRSGDTFTKLADPATLPTNNGYGCAFDPTGTYLAVAHVEQSLHHDL